MWFKTTGPCPGDTVRVLPWALLAASMVAFIADKSSHSTVDGGLNTRSTHAILSPTVISKNQDLDITTCVFVRTYEAHELSLPALIMSLLASGHQKLNIILADTGKRGSFKTRLYKIAETMNALAGRDVVIVSPHTFAGGRQRFPKLLIEDHGYVATDLMLEDALAQRERERSTGRRVARSCETMLFTNGDNLYAGRFLEATLHEISRGGAEMVGVNYFAHYFHGRSEDDTLPQPPATVEGQAAGACGVWRWGRDQEVWVASDFRVGCIDLGAVVVKASLLEATGYRFVADSLRAGDPTGLNVTFPGPTQCTSPSFAFCADGLLYQRLAAVPGVKTKVLRRSLMMHQ